MPDNDPVTTAFHTSDSGVVHVVSRPTPGHRRHRAAEYGLSGTSYLRPTRKRACVKPGPAKASIAARLGAPQTSLDYQWRTTVKVGRGKFGAGISNGRPYRDSDHIASGLPTNRKLNHCSTLCHDEANNPMTFPAAVPEIPSADVGKSAAYYVNFYDFRGDV
jgi:hypothetical protein